MTEQIKQIIDELRTIQAKLPELRDLYWLKIDRYNETDQQRGVVFLIAKDLSKKSLFSTETKNYLRPLEIANGLFVESNFSANQMCVSCKKLLDIYGITHSEVKLYLDRIPANK